MPAGAKFGPSGARHSLTVRTDDSLPFGVAPAVMGFMMVHATLRRDASDLVTAAERGSTGVLRDRVTLFARVLSVHHRGEDEVLLPALRARQPGFGPCCSLIEAQHEGLDSAVVELAGAIESLCGEETVALARGTQRLLEEHLSTEESQLLPVWQESFSLADHAEFSARLRRSTRLRDIAVMVPWLLEATPAEFRSLALSQVPAPTRAVHRLWWRRRFRRAYSFAP